jgi:Fe-S-cluster containining protein
MEIHIDLRTVCQIIAAEHSVATVQIRELGPIKACEQSQLRHDERLAGATDAGTLACRAGCFWCCFFSVDVRAVEVFGLLEFMERELAGEERERILRQIAINRQQLAGADAHARAGQNVQCPFLNQGRCMVYPVRPQTCRNYHATNVAGCQRSFEHPEDLDIDPEFAPLTYQIGGAHVDGFSKAMTAAGYDNCVYEMNEALAHALDDVMAARLRFEAGQAPFTGLEGIVVAPEFDEDQ